MRAPSPLSDCGGRLPQTDEERVLFYAELLVANMPLLLADLGSARYTLLSFSEKTRNEVRQKHAMLQQMASTLPRVEAAYAQLEQQHRALAACEVQLVRGTPPPSPPATATAAVAATATSSVPLADTQTATRHDDATATLTSATTLVHRLSPPPPPPPAPPQPVELTDEDAQPLRAAEAALDEATATLARLLQEQTAAQVDVAAARVRVEATAAHVQELRVRCDSARHAVQRAAHTAARVALLRDEAAARAAVQREAAAAHRALHATRQSSLRGLLERVAVAAREAAAAATEELQRRRGTHEVELAAFQIACKEAQAEAEALRERMTQLRHRERDLERIAKAQTTRERARNSLARALRHIVVGDEDQNDGGSAAVLSSPFAVAAVSAGHVDGGGVYKSSNGLHSSSSSNDKYSSNRAAAAMTPPLSPELEAQLARDHAQVCVLAARIHAMRQQRRTVAGILVQARDTQTNNNNNNNSSRSSRSADDEDDVVCKNTLERIQDVLAPAIDVDEDVLRDVV